MSDWDIFLTNLDLTDKKGALGECGLTEGKELRDLEQMDEDDLNSDILDDDDLGLSEGQKEKFREAVAVLKQPAAAAAAAEIESARPRAEWKKLVDTACHNVYSATGLLGDGAADQAWPQIKQGETSKQRGQAVSAAIRGGQGPKGVFTGRVLFPTPSTNFEDCALTQYILDQSISAAKRIKIVQMLGYLFILIPVLDIMGTPDFLNQLKSITGLEEEVIGLFAGIIKSTGSSTEGKMDDIYFIKPNEKHTPLIKGIKGLIDRVIEEGTLESTNEKLLELIYQQKEALEERKLSWARKQRSDDSIPPEAMQTAMAKMPWASFKPSLRGGGKKKRKSKKRRSKKRKSKKRRSKKRKTYRRRN